MPTSTGTPTIVVPGPKWDLIHKVVWRLKLPTRYTWLVRFNSTYDFLEASGTVTEEKLYAAFKDWNPDHHPGNGAVAKAASTCQ